MRLDDGRVLPNFMGQALRGEPLTVYGDGSQTRLVLLRRRPGRGHRAAAVHRLPRAGQPRQPDEVIDPGVRQEILELSGSKSQLVFKPLPQDDPKVRQPDITRRQQLLGWEPKIDRHEGLKRTLEYFQKQVGQR